MPRTSEQPLYLDQLGLVVALAYCWRFDEDIEYWYRNPLHGLTLVEHGTIEWDVPGGLVRGTAGDLVYNPPAPRGHYRVYAPATSYVLGLRLASRSHRFSVAGVGPLPTRLPLGTAAATMRGLMETLCMEVPRDGVEHRLSALATVYQIFALIARILRAEPTAEDKLDAWERARLRLASTEGHKLKIADLAHEMDVSVQYFQRGFRQRFGSSPKAYQLHSRIQEAVRRLRESDALFKTIAYEMGFRDPKILYHAICRHLGIGPTQARRMPSEELRKRSPKSDIPFPLNWFLVPPGTPAAWFDEHHVRSQTLSSKKTP